MMGTQLNGLTSGSLTLQPAAVTTNYSLTFPGAQGGAGQTLSNDGSGVLSWMTPLSSSTGFVNGGNTFAGNSSIGNNDNYNLDIKTNNTSRMTILNSGNVGIGTTTPTSRLHVSSLGNPSTSTVLPYFQAAANPTVSVNGTMNYVTVSSPTTNSRELGVLDYLYITPSADLTQSLYGRVLNSVVESTNTYTIPSVLGSATFNFNMGSGAITSMIGGQYIASNRGTATVTNLQGLIANSTNTTGTVTTQYGLSATASNSSANTVTNSYGVYSTVSNSSTGTISNAVSLKGVLYNTNTGTITSAQGVEGTIQNQTTGTINTAIGLTGGVVNSNTGTVGTATGTNSYVSNGSTGAMTNATGVSASASNGGAGSISTAYGVNATVGNTTSGTITSATGTTNQVTNNANGIISTAVGTGSYINNYGTGATITNAYAVQAQFNSAAGNTITNAYGVYISGLGAGGTWTNTPYDIYASDVGAYNYFAGNVGIGTTIPSVKLEVHSSASGGVPTIWGANSNSGVGVQGSTSGGGYGGNFTANGANATNVALYASASGGTNNYAAIFNGGNVGIGTTNPTYQLQLSTDSAAKPGTSTWTIASDERLKDIRAPFTRGLEALEGIHPIYFNYKSGNPLDLPSQKEYVGIRAQDALKAVPEAVSQDEKGFYHVTNDSIIWTVLNAVKELYHNYLNVETHQAVQDQDIASVKAENAQLIANDKAKDQKIKELEQRLEKIERALNSK
jgi:hypothetical protein